MKKNIPFHYDPDDDRFAPMFRGHNVVFDEQVVVGPGDKICYRMDGTRVAEAWVESPGCAERLATSFVDGYSRLPSWACFLIGLVLGALFVQGLLHLLVLP